MIGIVFCCVAFLVCWVLAKRSLAWGLGWTIAVGYAYGITRASYPVTASHFIFDAALGALYIQAIPRCWKRLKKGTGKELLPWVMGLVIWPCLMYLVPIQDYLVQLVGLRNAVWPIPMLLIGAALDKEDFRKLALCVAALSCAEAVLGQMEANMGVEAFYPHNEMTEILIYRVQDVAGGRLSRIPGSFISTAGYGINSTFAVALLAGFIATPLKSRWQNLLIKAGIAAASYCIFLSASRTAAVFFVLLIGAILIFARTSVLKKLALIVSFGVVVWGVAGSERLDRFETLLDSGTVVERVGGSVNDSFISALTNYPLGNGLGGGGTSMPYFLAERLVDPVLMENEYAHILLEQGIIGLLLWAGFLSWLLIRGMPSMDRNGHLARLAIWIGVVFEVVDASVGLGAFSAVPGGYIFMGTSGWLIARAFERPLTAKNPMGSVRVASIRPAFAAETPRFHVNTAMTRRGVW